MLIQVGNMFINDAQVTFVKHYASNKFAVGLTSGEVLTLGPVSYDQFQAFLDILGPIVNIRNYE